MPAWWRKVSSWRLDIRGSPSFPRGMSSQRPNNQQPKKKKKRLRQQPPTATTTPRPKKVSRKEASTATSPVSHLVDAWNEHVNIGRKDVDAGAFPPQVVAYIDEFCSKYEIEPAKFVKEAARCLHWKEDGRYRNATPSFVFNSKGAGYHRSLFCDQIKAVSERLAEQREAQQWQAAYNGILRAAGDQGKTAPTLERMELGWHPYRRGPDYVALEPSGVMSSIRIVTVHSQNNGVLEIYGTPSPSDDQRHQRNCELIEKVFYAASAIVGADRISEYGARKEFDDFNLLLEAAGID